MALVALLENPKTAADMGRAGRKRAEEMFGLPAFVAKYETVFASLAPEVTANGRSATP